MMEPEQVLDHTIFVYFLNRAYYEAYLDTIGAIFDGECPPTTHSNVELRLAAHATRMGTAVILEAVFAPRGPMMATASA